MNMFGAEPGAGFPPPTRAEQPGGELRLTLDGNEYLIRAGQTARIGRAPDNDLVTEAPTVSRHHGVRLATLPLRRDVVYDALTQPENNQT
jgi:hypothetical protein